MKRHFNIFEKLKWLLNLLLIDMFRNYARLGRAGVHFKFHMALHLVIQLRTDYSQPWELS